MSTHTEDHSKVVLFDPNGEALDFTDLNNLQHFEYLRNIEGLLCSGGVPDAIGNPDASPIDLPDLELGENWNAIGLNYADLVFAPFPGAGYFKASGSSNKLVSVGGPLIGITGDEPFNGDEFPGFALFRMAGNIEMTTAVGHATLPRIDIVEATFAYVDSDPESRDFEDAVTRAPTTQTPDKVRRVQLTLAVKQGTPAATPEYPTPTAGASAICAVYVPALHNAVHDPENIRDMRFPLGNLRVYDVPASQLVLQGANPWLYAPSALHVQTDATTTAATAALIAHCPIANKTARLMGIGIYGEAKADPGVELIRLDWTAGSAVPVVLADHDPGEIFDTVGFRNIGAIRIGDDLGSGGMPHVGTRATDRRICSPMWCNGRAAGPAFPTTQGEDPHSTLAVRITDEYDAAAAIVGFVRFYVAHGM